MTEIRTGHPFPPPNTLVEPQISVISGEEERRGEGGEGGHAPKGRPLPQVAAKIR